MNTATQRIWIFANGSLPQPQRLRAYLRPGDGLIAADGGQRYLAQLGLQAERVIGDLDSLSPAEVTALQAAGVILERYPVDKDETDLELALNRALELGGPAVEIRIAGALGGRLDQTLGNLYLLSRPDLVGVDVRLEDGSEEVFLIRSSARICGEVGDGLSLLPLAAPAFGITTTGLKYPLRGETLYPDHTRGISNVLNAPQAEVRLESGVLICIHTHQ